MKATALLIPKALFLIVIILLHGTNLAAQDVINNCPSDLMHEELLMEDLVYADRYATFEKLYRQRVQDITNAAGTKRSAVVYTLPVVVHILHSGEALGTTENPTDSYIENSITVSSQRFRHAQAGANTYAPPLDVYYGADTEIDLCLAHEDPDGNYTSGIVRYYDPINTQDPSSSFLNSIEWDTDKYINMFIATNIGGPCGYFTGGSNDYTVYLASCYNTGLVAHELGHYFSLAHTFAANGSCVNDDCLSDGDGVCDTPPKLNSGFTGSPCAAPGNECTTDEDDTSTNNPFRAVAAGGIGDQNDMLENYMDYTGSCWDCFTQGQKVRMRTYIDAFRVALKNNSAVCTNTATALNDVGIFHVFPNQQDVCDSAPNIAVTINNYGSNVLDNVDIEVSVDGTVQFVESWTGALESGVSESFVLNTSTSLPDGISTIEVRTLLPNGVADTDTSNDGASVDAESIGSSLSCTTFSDCTTLNPATANGPGNTTIINVTASYASSGVNTVEICVTFNGDTSFSGEVFTIYDESDVDRGTTQVGTDCGGPSPPACFNVAISDYYDWIADGSITITCDPVSTSINPALCSTNEVCSSILVAENSSSGYCAQDTILAGIINSGTYSTMNYIISSGTINAPGDVILNTNDSIQFPAGFEIFQGAQLEANTQGTGCN